VTPKTSSLICLLWLLSSFSPAQKDRPSASQNVDWKALTPQIQQALGDAYDKCFAERRWIEVAQTGDVNGDGVPEALVQFCHMGAYTSEATLLQLKNGKPLVSKFRDQNRKPVLPTFLQGASVRNGEDVKLAPEQHAVYAIHWHTGDEGVLETCAVEAYVWSAKASTFDYDAGASREIEKRDCRRLAEQL
jgi:hypothetical protein